MRERDRTLSIQKKKLLKATTFAVVLLSVAIMVTSGAVSAINLSQNSTKMNVNNGGKQPVPASNGGTNAGPAAGTNSNIPASSLPLSKSWTYTPQNRGTVIYDNGMNFDNGLFDAMGSPYGAQGADDFSFNVPGQTCIDDFHMVMIFGVTPSPTDTFSVEFFKDDGTGNYPGAVYAGPFTSKWSELSTTYLGTAYGTYVVYDIGFNFATPVCFPGCNEKFWVSAYDDMGVVAYWGCHYSPIYGSQAVWKGQLWSILNWVTTDTQLGSPADFTFQLTQKADHDVGVSAIISPVNGMQLCGCLPVSVQVTNYGKNDETNVPVEVKIMQDYLVAGFEEYYFGTIWQHTDSLWQYAYYVDGHYAHSGYYQMNLQSGNGYTNMYDQLYTVQTFNFATACDPQLSFWMWHDQFSTGDYIQVQYSINGGATYTNIGTPYYRSGATGWAQHTIDLAALKGQSNVKIAFNGYADNIGSGYNLQIDDVNLYDLAYDQTTTTNVGVGKTVTVTMPDYCPCQWNVLSNADITVYVNACTKMLTDQVPNNDCLTGGSIAIHFPFMHDVGGNSITVTDTGCLNFDVTGKIQNYGQYQECCFKVYADIYKWIETDYQTIFTENFESPLFGLPAGWTTNMPSNWEIIPYYYGYWYPYPSSNYLMLNWAPSFVGTSRVISPAINTVGMSMAKIDFDQYLSWYSGPGTLSVQTSTDGVNWADVQTWVNPSSWGTTHTSFETTTNVGGPTFYVAFTFTGDSFNLNWWCIDNLAIQGKAGYKGDHVYSDWFCVDTIDPCQIQTINFAKWIPQKPWPDCGSIKYDVCIKTVLCDPMDQNPVNDEYCTFVTVNFKHDVSTKITSPTKAAQTFYCMDTSVYPQAEVCSFDPTAPGVFTVINTYSPQYFPQNGCFVGDTWYQADDSGWLNTVDTGTGVVTPIGNSGIELIGLAYDPSSDTMYASNSNTLYKIDRTTAAVTMIGSMGNSGLMISISCDKTGNMYAYELSFSNTAFYSINTATGQATLIGYLGITTNFGQDMEFDKDNNILYAAVFNYGTYTGQLGTIDVTTGAFTYIGDLNGGHQITGFAIPYTGGPSMPKPDIWIKCGQQTLTATIKNNGNFDEVDDPATPCTFEGITVHYNLTLYNLTDPCKPPKVTVVADGTQTLELNCGESKDISFTYDFTGSGVYQLIFEAFPLIDCNWDNNIDVLNIGVDCCKPISDHTLTPLIPDGQNNWYLQNVKVKVTASDPLCPNPCLGTASGVKEIHYVLNGVETVKAGTSVSFTVKDEGVNLIKYWAVDKAGNVEDPFTFEVAIDTIKPSADLIYEKITGGTVLQIKFTAVVSDATSGIAKVAFTIGSGTPDVKTSPPYTWTVDWQASYKTTTFKIDVWDSAGNTNTASIYGGDIPTARTFASSLMQSHSVPRAAASLQK